MEAWVKDIYAAFALSDIELHTAGNVLDATLFSELSTDVAHPVSVRTLSLPFKSYKHFTHIQKFAKLSMDISVISRFGIELAPSVSSAQIDSTARRVSDALATALRVLSSKSSEMITRTYISIVLIEAVDLVNSTRSSTLHQIEPSVMITAATKPVQAAYADIRSHKVGLDCETELVGTRAHGFADFALYIEYLLPPHLSRGKETEPGHAYSLVPSTRPDGGQQTAHCEGLSR